MKHEETTCSLRPENWRLDTVREPVLAVSLGLLHSLIRCLRCNPKYECKVWFYLIPSAYWCQNGKCVVLVSFNLRSRMHERCLCFWGSEGSGRLGLMWVFGGKTWTWMVNQQIELNAIREWDNFSYKSSSFSRVLFWWIRLKISRTLYSTVVRTGCEWCNGR